MSAPVFVAPAGSLDAVRAGDEYVLTGPEGRHAAVVQRRGAGERVDVVDGRGVRLATTVVEARGTDLALQVQAVTREPEPPVRLVLVQALAKGDRDEMAIEAATEVGVDAVVPWQAERSVVVWRGQRAEKSRGRWGATVTAATKQARRAFLPPVEQVLSTRALAVRTADVTAAGGVVVILHEESPLPLADVPLPGGGELLVVVGPEGGIGQAEVDLLTEAGARTARLGPHVLRTSTAGPVALAVLSERLGRWRES
ncbi:16S rRNA (uracil1498-N3)-methyltransferase [Paraoerskovia marina]|uniref:Ribosomal RNA small subunit methyltransferase E n=1 Tax=Paraoerskovia marina TaxID=545619 RepID=A0A1H1RV29_9CELL|nr:16S rRNA (uracil(1498)-N(3))-methyltransferase [Paraoerskovia marina]SDS39627.1 16S rRNA (uracil1498-N3)-methyltransferase [Paraoerskovia marina]